MQTLISKIGMALTAFVTLQVLDEYGYDSKFAKMEISDELFYSDGFQKMISGNWMATTLLCGLSMAACAIPLFFYTFTEKRQVEAVARVLARKKASGVMNEAEAGEFVEQLKNVESKTQEKTYTQIAEILGWENADSVREFIRVSDEEARLAEENQPIYESIVNEEDKAETENKDDSDDLNF